MNLNPFFKSIIEQETVPVVICSTDHIIIYMNPAAIENYRKRGGAELIGKSLLDCHNERSVKIIKSVAAYFEKNSDNDIVFTHFNEKKNLDIYMVALRDEDNNLIGYYEKQTKHEEKPSGERFKLSL